MNKKLIWKIGIVFLIMFILMSSCYAQDMKSQVEALQKKFSGEKPASDAFLEEFIVLLVSAVGNPGASPRLKDRDVDKEVEKIIIKMVSKIGAGAGSDDFINLFIDWYGVDVEKEGPSFFWKMVKFLLYIIISVIIIMILFTTLFKRSKIGIWMRGKMGRAFGGGTGKLKMTKSLEKLINAINKFRKKDPLRL